jgi:hypothetical protein
VTGVNITNTPLTTVTPTSLIFGGAAGYTQGNLTTPGNQPITATLAEGTGGTPAGPGSPGTGTLSAVVAASSFAAGSCVLAAGQSGTPNVTAGPANWLAVTQTSTGSGSAAVYTDTVAVNPAVFPTLTAPITCTGAITISSSGVTPAAATKTVPVTFTMNPAPGFQMSPASPGPFTIVNGYPVSLTTPTGAPIPITVSSPPTEGQAYTVTIQNVTGGSWLTTTATSGTTTLATPGFSLGVAAAANTLSAAGSPYYATVTIAPSNSSQPVNTPPLTFTVQLNVDATDNLTVTGTPALSGGAFSLGTHFIDFTVPASQVLNVAASSPTAGAPNTPNSFTVTQNSLTGSTPAGLLTITPSSSITSGNATTVPVTISYLASVANSLPAGSYGGTLAVTITQAGSTTIPQTVLVPWTLTIDSEALIQTTPTANQGIIINCVIGSTCTAPAVATVPVTASSTGLPVNVPFSVSYSSLPTPWLSALPLSGTANSTSLTLSANTVGLQVNTSYAGQLVITSASAANSGYTIPVTLNVLPPPTCQFSFTSGSTVSLPSTGTATPSTSPTGSGVLPEVPVTIGITPNSLCAGGTYTVTYPSSSWLTVTGGSGVTIVSALSNAHSTAESVTLTITNSASAPGYSQTVTVTEAGSAAPELDRQITALYQSVLGRDPDAPGFTFWAAQSATSLGQMVDDFLTSPESFNSNFAVIAAYQAASGAAPSYANFETSLASLRGGTALTTIFNGLIAGNTSYSATTLYQNLLNRAPTSSTADTTCIASGLAQCFETLIGYGASVSPVGTGLNNEFMSAGTFANHTPGTAAAPPAGDHTNGLYIYLLYFTILNRNPDAGGLLTWLNVADGGGAGILFQGATSYPTRIQILGNGLPNEGFVGSPEFQGLYQ